MNIKLDDIHFILQFCKSKPTYSVNMWQHSAFESESSNDSEATRFPWCHSAVTAWTLSSRVTIAREPFTQEVRLPCPRTISLLSRLR